jgi:hypothetical protein
MTVVRRVVRRAVKEGGEEDDSEGGAEDESEGDGRRKSQTHER